jgi:DNA-binding IclR family transcriptional regulator
MSDLFPELFTCMNGVLYFDRKFLVRGASRRPGAAGEEARMAEAPQDAGARDFRPVKSAYRALDVLEALTVGPAGLSELARRLDIPKSSLHGLLRTLSERGWVTSHGGTFRLGLRALQVGARFIDEDEVVARVAPSLDRLAAVTGETVQHARLDGDQVVYLAKRDSAHQVRLVSSIGSRLPAHATALGKSLLAARDDDTVAALLSPPMRALTARTVTSWEALAAQLADARERGYAVDDGEAAEGLRCFAVTVPSDGLDRGPYGASVRGPDGGAGPDGRRDGSAAPSDAISVSVPAFRLDTEGEAALVRSLLEVRASLGRGLPPLSGRP